MAIADTRLRLPLLMIDAPVLPGAVVTIALSDDRRRSAVDAARRGDGRLLLAEADQTLGVLASVPDIGNLPTGEPAAIVHATQRGRIVETSEVDPLRPESSGTGSTEPGPSATGDGETAPLVDVEVLVEPTPNPTVEAAAQELRATLSVIAELRGSRRLPDLLRTVSQPGALADAVALWAEFGVADRRRILDAVDVAVRVDAVHAWARGHLNELRLAEDIRNDVTEGMGKQQREYLLRQQLNSIRRELGESDDDVAADFRERLAGLDVPDDVRGFIAKELDRFERMSEQSPEHGWVRTWLERVFALPWGLLSDDVLDLAAAQAVLDDDHHGLDDVKERIVEFLATRKLRRDRGLDERTAAGGARRGRGHGTVLTLVGPPGVGKTSLGESIARAMGREFVRVALGGVRDEAEIRGHRRTYVGAQPGRLVRAIQDAGTMNPVILLDEVDKLGAGGWSGDPTAALLEVLDPAQNHTFRDHYLEVDLDLSDVVFIATANVADTIPAPLLDRMDVIRLDGYTTAEKAHIAERYLFPRQLERAGLTPVDVELGDGVLVRVIEAYTREAGVRSLERQLGRLAGKVAARVATGTPVPVVVGRDDVTEWLGRPTVDDELPERTSSAGVATGLAVTGVGGDVLFVETTAFPTGPEVEPGLTLTGQLGDVMKESAQIALNYVRSHAEELGLDDDALRRRFHVHVPAGAIPKDGPSAGITITTALVSLLTGRPVKPTIGMTGEITLQGQVLPIGGVKQKVLAAHRHGLTEVVLPARNERDLDDVPDGVLADLTVHLARDYEQVVAVAFDAVD